MRLLGASEGMSPGSRELKFLMEELNEFQFGVLGVQYVAVR